MKLQTCDLANLGGATRSQAAPAQGSAPNSSGNSSSARGSPKSGGYVLHLGDEGSPREDILEEWSNGCGDGDRSAETLASQLADSLPPHYREQTSEEERLMHARMLRTLRQQPSRYSVSMWKDQGAWDHSGQGRTVRLHVVFPDRPGSIGVILSALGKLGLCFRDAAVFVTADGYAVDAFTIGPVYAELHAQLGKHVAHAVMPPGTQADEAATNAAAQQSAPVLSDTRSGSGSGSSSSDPMLRFASSSLPSLSSAEMSQAGMASGSSQSDIAGSYTPVGESQGFGSRPSASSLPFGAPASMHLYPDATPASWIVPNEWAGWRGDAFKTGLPVIKSIGEGSVSRVWHTWWKEQMVATKVLKHELMHYPEAHRSFMQEAYAFEQLDHPSICKFYGKFVCEGAPALVLEYMAGGNLYDYLHCRGRTPCNVQPADELSRLALEVAAGIEYRHSVGLMHRDIKSTNILLDDQRHAKISDFGISTRADLPEHTAETGTYRFMAPEVITQQKYDNKCDVFSFGMLLWEMMHQDIPLRGQHQLQAAYSVAILKRRPGIELRKPLKCFADVITACWEELPADRPTMEQVVHQLSEININVKAAAAADRWLETTNRKKNPMQS